MIFTGRSFSGRERHCAFLNVGDLTAPSPRFARISAVSGLDLPDDGRAVASVDWDQDGDLDLWISNRNAPRLRFFRNDQKSGGHFMALRLQGNGTTTTRDAIGARVEVHLDQAGHKPLVKTLRAGEGFLGQSSKWLHFGLGQASGIRKVIVRWPGGEAQEFTGLSLNSRYRLIQQESAPLPEPARFRALEVKAGAPELPAACEGTRIPLAYRLPMVRVPYKTFSGTEKWARFDSGQPVLLTLWASWCSPCLGELTELTERHADLREAGLEVLAVSVDGFGDASSPEDAQKRAESLGLPFTTGQATAQLLSTVESMHHRQIPMRTSFPLPTSFLLDSRGRLAVVYKGPVSVDTLLTDLDNLDGDLNARFRDTAALPGRLIPHPMIELARRRTETLIRFRLAGDLEQGQRFEEAAIHYRGVLELSPEYAEAHNNLGNVLDRLGESAEAEIHLREAIRLKPDFAFAHHNLGNALLHQDSPFTSLSSYREAIRLDPSEPGFYFSHANAQLAAGEGPAKAIKTLEQALELNPDFESAHFLLGYIYENTGEREKALASYATVLELNPENAAVRERRDRLK